MNSHHSLIFPLLLAASAALAATPETTAPEAFSHDDWTTVLEKFVDEDGLVDYHALALDRAALDRYIAAVEASDPRNRPDLFPTREHRLAYYLNAYNAQVFQGVLARGPEEESVWKGLVSGLNFFVRMKVVIGREKMSLKYLEDKLIREGFQDPRIHAALNCASISCPPLPQRAFVAETLDEDLDAAMGAFIADPRNCRVSESAEKVQLSEIFNWFAKDFLSYEKGQGHRNPQILDYVNRYRPEDEQIPRTYQVNYFEYDKGINQQPR